MILSKNLEKYFELEKHDNLLFGSKPYSAITRILPQILKLKDVFFHNWVSPKPVKVENFSYYKGYYQTAYYYEHLKIPLPLNLKEKYTQEFAIKYGELFNNHKTVVVHIRRTDYMSYGERRKRDISLPLAYFKKRIDAIENLNDYQVIFCK